jgi:hypothetical protein
LEKLVTIFQHDRSTFVTNPKPKSRTPHKEIWK